jgi:predicted secreted protein
MILPIGVRISEQGERGLDAGAPDNPRIGRKIVLTTGVSIPLFFLAKWLIDANVLGV